MDNFEPSVSFHNPLLSELLPEFEKAGKKRFDELGEFQKDVKGLTVLLKKYGIPKFECLASSGRIISWVDGKILFASCNGMGDAIPILECSAETRTSVMRINLLPEFFKEIIDNMKEDKFDTFGASGRGDNVVEPEFEEM